MSGLICPETFRTVEDKLLRFDESSTEPDVKVLNKSVMLIFFHLVRIIQCSLCL